MTTLGWGMLAPGGIADLFAQDLQATGRRLVAVGSRSLERAEAFAEKHQATRAYGSYEALVQDDAVEAVYIASPHVKHAEHAELALRNGKHVLVEKPFALTGAEAARIRDLAREAGLFAMEAMRTRFLPHTLRCHELIAEGALGDIRALTADHFQRLDSTPEGRLWNPHLGGGALLDLGVYAIAFAFDFLGAPERVEAMATMTPTGVDLSTSMSLGFGSGAIASLQTGMDARGPNRASIIGEKARIELGPVFYRTPELRLIGPNDELIEEFSAPYPHWGKQFEAEEVERCVAAGLTESPRMRLDDSVSIAETMDRVRGRIGLSYPC